jgi:hypothetical protein
VELLEAALEAVGELTVDDHSIAEPAGRVVVSSGKR